MTQSRSTPAAEDPSAEAFWDKMARTGPGCRRTFPRVHAPVRVVFAGASRDERIRAVCHDLSLGGMQVRCDREIAARIVPEGHRNSDRPLSAYLKLKLDGVSLRVIVKCRVAHLSLRPDAPVESAVAIGFEFVEFATGAQRTLEKYVEDHLRPAEL